jgi:hypothetical protein
VTLDVISHEGHILYGWLKATADNLLAASEQDGNTARMPQLISTDILPQYRAGAEVDSSDTPLGSLKKKKRKTMTHVGIITECYQPREVELGNHACPVGQ